MNLPLKFKLLMFTHTSILLHCPFSEIPPSLEHCPFKSYLCPLRMQCPVHISEHIFGNFVHVQYSIHKQKRSRIVPGKHSTVKIRWSSYSIEEHHVVENNETSNWLVCCICSNIGTQETGNRHQDKKLEWTFYRNTVQ